MKDIIEVDRNNFKHFMMSWKKDPIFDRGLCIHTNKENGSGRKHLEYLDEVVRADKCRINNLGKEVKSRRISEIPKNNK
jgi:hypothetical protein